MLSFGTSIKINKGKSPRSIETDFEFESDWFRNASVREIWIRIVKCTTTSKMEKDGEKKIAFFFRHLLLGIFCQSRERNRTYHFSVLRWDMSKAITNIWTFTLSDVKDVSMKIACPCYEFTHEQLLLRKYNVTHTN